MNMTMYEITILGRGGQGAVTSAYVLAKAAFHDGMEVQAFPFFGVERRGAPVMSFCRISDEPVKLREQIYKADYFIVLDPALLSSVNVLERVKDHGEIIVNSAHFPEKLGKAEEKGVKVSYVDATETALEIIGKPFVNIIMLGAFAAISKLVTLNALEKAIEEHFSSKPEAAELNKKATEVIFKALQK